MSNSIHQQVQDLYARFQDASSLKEHHRIWLEMELGEENAQAAFDLPVELLHDLYGNIFSYGPQGEAVLQVYETVRIQLDEMGWFNTKQNLRDENLFPAMKKFYKMSNRNDYMTSFVDLMIDSWMRDGQLQAYSNIIALADSVTQKAHAYIELEYILEVRRNLAHLLVAVGTNDLMTSSRRHKLLVRTRNAALEELGCLHVIS